jgi:hypothetical protein
MSIKYSEDPKAWRKSTLLSVLPLLILDALLWWRHVLSPATCASALVVLTAVGVASWIRPQLFGGYYRFSTWAGYWSSQCVARVALAIIFGLLIVPLAVIRRALGKDALQLKRSPEKPSYWKPARSGGSLDRQF